MPHRFGCVCGECEAQQFPETDPRKHADRRSFAETVVREAIRKAIRSLEPQVLRHCAELELLEEETLP